MYRPTDKRYLSGRHIGPILWPAKSTSVNSHMSHNSSLDKIHPLSLSYQSLHAIKSTQGRARDFSLGGKTEELKAESAGGVHGEGQQLFFTS